MNDLTLDVCILLSGSGIGNRNYQKDCFELMKRMLGLYEYKLALDEKGKIRHQYLEKNKEGTFGHHFIIKMALEEKTVIIPWRQLNQGIRVKLEKKGFTRDNEDYKFVICASGTHCNKLVTHEPHFFNVSNILNRIPVRVLWPHNART